MSREAALARGRAFAEQGMVDTCVITRTASSSTDQDTGVITRTTETIYSGKCRFQWRDATAAAEKVGEAELRLLSPELQLPMSVAGLKVSDEVECTSAARDPDLPGRTFKVKDLFHKTDATARRIRLVEVT